MDGVERPEGEGAPVQMRYLATAGRREAQALYDAFESAFEEEGPPLVLAEIDEAAEIFEVSIYLDTRPGEDRTGELAALAEAAAGRSVAIRREDIPDIDWMAAVLAELKPVRAGRFLVHGSHDRDKVRPGDLAIEIDAGQAFGTGHHGTTAGCLLMIEAICRRRRLGSALDLGTGSAVLAIGLARLARVPVLATDIDPVAVAVAAENVARNGVAALVHPIVARGFDAPAIRRSGPYDLVVANILAKPLQSMAHRFAAALAPGGEVVLSGILATQRRAVIASFVTAGLFHRETLRRGDWVTIRLSR